VNLGKTSCAPRRLSTAVEFAGSHMRSMNRKPSSVGIAGVEPRHQPTAVSARAPCRAPLYTARLLMLHGLNRVLSFITADKGVAGP
jgi:hypothetical protein